jgi:hypothetical protein
MLTMSTGSLFSSWKTIPRRDIVVPLISKSMSTITDRLQTMQEPVQPQIRVEDLLPVCPRLINLRMTDELAKFPAFEPVSMSTGTVIRPFPSL